MTEVAPGVHRLGTQFVNWYVLETDDGIVAIDSGFPGYAKTLENDLRALGRSLDDVRAVVLTHGDGDHTGTPGHTHGHCVFHHADRGVLFAGDELCTRNPLTGRE